MKKIERMSYLHTDMKIIDQKVTERAVTKVSRHYFSILNEVE
jgi:hypothetical protein